MPMIDMPVTPASGAEVVIERRVGEAGNRGVSPVVAVSAVAGAAQPNWIGNDKGLLQHIERKLKIPVQFAKSSYRYETNGPLGMPRLTVNYPVDYAFGPAEKNKRAVIPQGVGLAQKACVSLDIEAKQAGAWGPECKIAKFLKMPEGKLVKATEPYVREGDYQYTPPKIGTDTAHFILENGAGKKVEVIFKINATSYREGAIESEKKWGQTPIDQLASRIVVAHVRNPY